MRARGVALNTHTFSALINVYIKAGEPSMALDAYSQVGCWIRRRAGGWTHSGAGCVGAASPNTNRHTQTRTFSLAPSTCANSARHYSRTHAAPDAGRGAHAQPGDLQHAAGGLCQAGAVAGVALNPRVPAEPGAAALAFGCGTTFLSVSPVGDRRKVLLSIQPRANPRSPRPQPP
jgi:pentatricopeptide repeat protein